MDANQMCEELKGMFEHLFKDPPTLVVRPNDEGQDVVVIDDGMFLYQQEVDAPSDSILSDRQKILRWAADVEIWEHNYPHEPDWQDVCIVILPEHHDQQFQEKVLRYVLDHRLGDYRETQYWEQQAKEREEWEKEARDLR